MQYDCMIYHGADKELDIITELGEERRIAAAILSAGWSLSAVAVTDTVNAELIRQKPQPPPA